jgi:excisionase family DNA binding protein
MEMGAGQPRESAIDEWLTLREAAERLAVHPTTLRRWADSGQVPFFLTPGGHRRFAASDIRRVAQRQHRVVSLGPVERMWADQAVARARAQMASHEAARWLGKLNTDSRPTHRALGQRLMALILEFVGADERGDDVLGEAREIGAAYGRAFREIGLPMSAALETSFLFRDALLESAIELPANVRIPPRSQAHLIVRINKVLNAVEIGLADAYAT